MTEPLDLAAIRACAYRDNEEDARVQAACDEIERLRALVPPAGTTVISTALFRDMSAQITAMRPVVEAAVAWADNHLSDWGLHDKLKFAVAAYRAALDSGVSPQPRSDAEGKP